LQSEGTKHATIVRRNTNCKATPTVNIKRNALAHTPKWLKWEFWPYWFFYLPVYAYYLWLSLRARSLTFFTAANPGMDFGGFVNYAKYDILIQLPAHLRPVTVYIKEDATTDAVERTMLAHGISYPIILKPNRGERGFGVAKLNDRSALAAYLHQHKDDLILQGYADLPEEYGILYYRLPGQPKGWISSIVQKDFLAVVGDGRLTLNELFQQQQRTTYHIDMLRRLYHSDLNTVLPAGQVKNLVEIGNHSRGTTFLNANHLISTELAALFDKTSAQLVGFTFGRYDLRTESFTALLRGEFKVVEVNGVNSEPAHIYDPSYRLLQAYRDLFRHWKILFRIAQANRRLGHKPAPFWPMVRTIRGHLKHKKTSLAQAAKATGRATGVTKG
jgi:hypothetical protein